MPLKWDDFLIKKINWSSKNINLIEIANELNLGGDSFIFIDDNPFEIGTVKEFTNVKTTILFENNYNKLLKLTRDYCFQRKKILTADLEKNKQYKIEQLRKQEENGFSSFESYLKNLNLKVEIKENEIDNLDRLSQMTEKTNQFNFNKIPYTAADLKDWISRGNFIYSCQVSDKFGDYGTVGLILVEKVGPGETEIHNFLLSCRALGKKIEFTFYNHVLQQLKHKKLNLNGIVFKETLKNEPAKTFLNQIKNESEFRTIK